MLDKRLEQESVVVYDNVPCLRKKDVLGLHSKGIRQYIVEPFRAFHHAQGVSLFTPHPLNDEIMELLRQNILSLIPASLFDHADIRHKAETCGTQSALQVYTLREKEISNTLTALKNITQHHEISRIFKMHLVNALTFFHSNNLYLQAFEEHLGVPFVYISENDLENYEKCRRLLDAAGVPRIQHRRTTLRRYPRRAILKKLPFNKLLYTAYMAYQALGALVLRKKAAEKNDKPRLLGVCILSGRQLTGFFPPDFLVDGVRITSRDMVYMLQSFPKKDMRNALRQSDLVHVHPPHYLLLFRSAKSWLRILYATLKDWRQLTQEEVKVTALAVFTYLAWKELAAAVPVRNFVTMADFGPLHVARNIALNQAGTRTWYYSDSNNHTLHYRPHEIASGCYARVWSFLFYDDLVTWDKNLCEFFLNHPGSFKRCHAVGCLRGSFLDFGTKRKSSTDPTADTHYFTIAAFDSGYSLKGVSDIEEGIAYARDLLRLLQYFTNLRLLIKPKIGVGIYRDLDKESGDRMVAAYSELASHERAEMLTFDTPASKATNAADMVVSFAFTSTTYEALSVCKPAIWHDPLGRYRKVTYAQVPGLVSHSFQELTAFVEARMQNPDADPCPFPPGSNLMDPYRDGKAIERFRGLLLDASYPPDSTPDQKHDTPHPATEEK